MNHTDICVKRRYEYIKNKEYYIGKYPNYCNDCDGYGERVQLSIEGQFYSQACQCIDDLGVCPRCSEDIETDSENIICEKCGFILFKTPGLPIEPECFCDIEFGEIFE